MRKFKVNVEITKEYIVEVDDDFLTEEDLEGWESVFHSLDSEEDKISSLAKDYCEIRADLRKCFIEGYGVVLKKGEKANGYSIKEDDVCQFMRIIECDNEGDIDSTLKDL